MLDSLLGLPLEEARALLGTERAVVLVRAEPPFFPRGYTPQWGEERVLRAREESDGRVELLVGRELIGETRTKIGASTS